MIDTLNAVEVIIAAWDEYRRRGVTKNRANREIVQDIYTYNTKADHEEDVEYRWVPGLHVTVMCNLGFSAWYNDAHTDNIKLDITDSIKARAVKMRDLVMQTSMFEIMQGKINPFMRGISEILNKEKLVGRDLKKLCYVVNVAENIEKNQRNQDVYFSARNDYVAAIGETVKVNAKVLAIRYSQEYGVYSHTCITDENFVVSFFNKTKHQEGDVLTVNGKVKDHRRVYNHEDVAETRLNYTKIINIIKG